MKLVHPAFENQIIIYENKANVIVIENPELLTDIVFELKNQISGKEGSFILSNNMEYISLSKAAEICVDPFSLDFNSRKLISSLYEKLRKRALDEDMYLDTAKVTGDILLYIENLLFSVDSDFLEYNLDIDITSIFKCAEVKFSTDYEKLSERLLDYMSIYNEYCHTELFIFVNLKSYISNDELKNLYDTLFYRKIKILLIESMERNQVLDCELIHLIDNDLCQIK